MASRDGRPTRDVQRRLLTQSIADFNHFRRANPMVRIDFSRGKFWRENLSEVNLKDANLYMTSFAEARLTGATLAGACLEKACLKGADLEDVNLSFANLSFADLRGTNLSKAELFKARLHYAKIVKNGVGFINPEDAKTLFFAVFEEIPRHYIASLREKLETGTLDTSTPNVIYSPLIQWLKGIEWGDTEKSNPAVAITLSWIYEWERGIYFSNHLS